MEPLVSVLSAQGGITNAGDLLVLRLWLIVWMIYLFGGTAYQDINGLSRATAALPSDKVEWTIFRSVTTNNFVRVALHLQC